MSFKELTPGFSVSRDTTTHPTKVAVCPVSEVGPAALTGPST